MAVGDSGDPGPLIMTSSDTINWVQRQGPTNLANDLFFDNITGSRIAYGNGQFVSVGWCYNEQALVVISSTDGAIWVRRFVGPRAAPPFFGSDAYSIVYGNGRFVVVPAGWSTAQGGFGAISDDGVCWTSVQSETNGGFEAVTYGHGQFVAVGPHGSVATSPNGVNWTQGQTGTTDWLEDWLGGVVYGNGRYVAWGFQITNSPVMPPVLMTSLDGVNWTERLWAKNGGFHINGIAFGQGRFVAVSGFNVFTSTDGANWTAGATNTNEVYLVAYGDSRFVAEDASGTILESGPFSSVALMPRFRHRPVHALTDGSDRACPHGPELHQFDLLAKRNELHVHSTQHNHPGCDLPLRRPDVLSRGLTMSFNIQK